MSQPSSEQGRGSDRGGVVCSTVKIRGAFDVAFVIDDRLDDPIGRSIAEHQQYPVGVTSELMMHLLRPGQTVLDLGAHIGTYALPAAAMGCRVIAVDGSPRNVELLQDAKARNGFDRLTVVHAAVSDRPGRLTFSPCGPHGHVTAALEAGHMPRVEVPAVTVDDLLAELSCDRVDLVKMDVEGWEPHVVQGMRRLLSRADAPLVIFESNSAQLEYYGNSTDEVLAALEGFGYRHYLIDHHEMGRLVPVSAGDVQPECVLDYLAARSLPENLSPWRILPFSHQEWTTRVLLACTDPHPPYRKHAATALQSAPGWMVDQPGVREALRMLRFDLDVAVRKAAAWSALLPEPRSSGPSLVKRLGRWVRGKAA